MPSRAEGYNRRGCEQAASTAGRAGRSMKCVLIDFSPLLSHLPLTRIQPSSYDHNLPSPVILSPFGLDTHVPRHSRDRNLPLLCARLAPVLPGTGETIPQAHTAFNQTAVSMTSSCSSVTLSSFITLRRPRMIIHGTTHYVPMGRYRDVITLMRSRMTTTAPEAHDCAYEGIWRTTEITHEAGGTTSLNLTKGKC